MLEYATRIIVVPLVTEDGCLGEKGFHNALIH